MHGTGGDGGETDLLVSASDDSFSFGSDARRAQLRALFHGVVAALLVVAAFVLFKFF